MPASKEEEQLNLQNECLKKEETFENLIAVFVRKDE